MKNTDSTSGALIAALPQVRPPSTVRKTSVVVEPTEPGGITHTMREESTLIRQMATLFPVDSTGVTSLQLTPPSIVRRSSADPRVTAHPVWASNKWINSKDGTSQAPRNIMHGVGLVGPACPTP